MKRRFRRREIGFHLDNSYHRKLNLGVYLGSVFIVFISYIVARIFFKESITIPVIIGIISISIGLTLVFHRENIVKVISNILYDRRRKIMKQESIENKDRTLKKIVPRNSNLRLNIKGKMTLKERLDKMKKVIKKEKKKNDKYIEINN